MAVLGIIAATLLGFFIGVIRLSPNWLVSRGALVYIEIFNVPLLLQIMFWNFAIFLPTLPRRRIQLQWDILSQRPWLSYTVTGDRKCDRLHDLGRAIAALIIGLVIFARRAKVLFEETGSAYPWHGSVWRFNYRWLFSIWFLGRR